MIINVKSGYNTQESPGDLWRLVVTCCHSEFREKSPWLAGLKHSQGVKQQQQQP